MMKSSTVGKLLLGTCVAGVLFFSLSLLPKEPAVGPSRQVPAAVKKSGLIPTVNTSEQLAKYHGMERVIDTQAGVICYKMIQKETLSCVALRDVGIPRDEMAPPPT